MKHLNKTRLAVSMLELRHRPSGWGHPYENGPDERVPRKPIVGETIELRSVSEPAGSICKVWWKWWHAENEPKQVSAERVPGQDNASDHWVAQLPPQNQLTTVTYQLWGETLEGDVLKSGEFTVDVLEWIAPNRLESIQTKGSRLQIKCHFNGLPEAVLFDYCLDDQLNLIIDHRIGKDEENQNAAQGLWQLAAETRGSQTWKNGGWEIVIDKNNQMLLIKKDNQVLLKEAHPFEILISPRQTIHAYRRFIKTKDAEVFIGCGERFNALNQRGERLDTRVYEQYLRQGEKTYIPIPFYISSRGYGLFQNMSRRAQFDFPEGYASPLVITQETGDDFIGQTVLFAHDNLEEIIGKFTRFVALPKLPPIWAFGLWMSSNEWYNQSEVTHQVDLMKKHQIPATVLVIEAWSDEQNFYIWNDAEYQPIDPAERFTLADFTFPKTGLWPDPKGMIEHLHHEGLKLVLWQIPVLKHLFPHEIDLYGGNQQHDLDETHMIEEGYCVHRADGRPYRVPPIWFSESLVLDVTNPKAVAWWLSKRQYLLDEIGIDGFKTDGGEHTWGEDLQFFDGRTNAELWNEYPKLYQQQYYDFANAHRGGKAVTFSRAGYTGSQRAPCHWAGDQDSTWESFRAVLLAGQNLGISGVPFWGWDIGGFSGPIPSADLYLRSAAAATFAPVMQYHSEHNQHKPVSVDRTPWNIQERTGDTRVMPAFRKFANLRMNLLPYLYSEAVFRSQNGLPMFGSPFVKFNDPKCLDFPTQFLCGRHLLVAPVVEPGVEEWQVYLPEGRWVDFWHGNLFEGGQTINVDVAIDSIPVFVQAGSVLPFNLNQDLHFGSPMSNRLDRYDVLAKVQFGETDPDVSYLWTDYVTKGHYLLDGSEDSMEALKPLRSVCNKIVALRIL